MATFYDSWDNLKGCIGRAISTTGTFAVHLYEEEITRKRLSITLPARRRGEIVCVLETLATEIRNMLPEQEPSTEEGEEGICPNCSDRVMEKCEECGLEMCSLCFVETNSICDKCRTELREKEDG